MGPAPAPALPGGAPRWSPTPAPPPPPPTTRHQPTSSLPSLVAVVALTALALLACLAVTGGVSPRTPATVRVHALAFGGGRTDASAGLRVKGFDAAGPTSPEAPTPPPPPPSSPSRLPRVGLCAVVKDQGEDLAEFVDWHLALGASTAYIFDHNSSVPAVAALGPHVADGRAVVVRFARFDHPSGKAQLWAYDQCLTARLGGWGWAGGGALNGGSRAAGRRGAHTTCGHTLTSLAALWPHQRLAGFFGRGRVFGASRRRGGRHPGRPKHRPCIPADPAGGPRRRGRPGGALGHVWYVGARDPPGGRHPGRLHAVHQGRGPRKLTRQVGRRAGPHAPRGARPPSLYIRARGRGGQHPGGDGERREGGRCWWCEREGVCGLCGVASGAAHTRFPPTFPRPSSPFLRSKAPSPSMARPCTTSYPCITMPRNQPLSLAPRSRAGRPWVTTRGRGL